MIRKIGPEALGFRASCSHVQKNALSEVKDDLMKNPWMDAWLKAVNETLTAAQTFWTELLRGQAPGTPPEDSAAAPSKPENAHVDAAPRRDAEEPAAQADSPPEAAAAPRTTARAKAAEEQKTPAAPKRSGGTKSAAPKSKTAAKKNGASNAPATARKDAGSAKASASPAKAADGAGTSAPKFQHPADPKLTWSGRGRRPRWVTEALEGGRSLDDLRIRKH